jgi:DNA-binding response OmpR family regulator
LTETGLFRRPGERRLNLLVIEDDEKILRGDQRILLARGLYGADGRRRSGRVQAALGDRPDAIVLDLMLPKMDGLAVCRELREKALHPDPHADGERRRGG